MNDEDKMDYNKMNGTKDDGTMRSFDTGATRDTGEGKLDYEGFFSPVFMEQFAKYMNMHRLQSDGKLRDSDNWQKGIPTDVCIKSLYRHFMETWKEHRGWETEGGYLAGLMGMTFNIQMMTLNYIKEHGMQDFDGEEPTPEMAERKKKLAKKDAVRDYNEAMAIHLSDIQPGEGPLPTWVPTLEAALTTILRDAGKVDSLKVVVNPDERDDTPCTCPPGDCDCNTGRIYGFAMPECDRSNQDEDGSCPYCDLPFWKCHCDDREDED